MKLIGLAVAMMLFIAGCMIVPLEPYGYYDHHHRYYDGPRGYRYDRPNYYGDYYRGYGHGYWRGY